MENENLLKLDTGMKWEKALDSILSEKGTIYRSYQEGWLKALENYDRIIKVKHERSFQIAEHLKLFRSTG